MEYYSAIKKIENFPICSSMNEVGGHYAKLRKSEKGKYCVISHIWNVKSMIN